MDLSALYPPSAALAVPLPPAPPKGFSNTDINSYLVFQAGLPNNDRLQEESNDQV